MLGYFFRIETDTSLDEQIGMVLQEMRSVGVNSDRYPVLMEYLERLNGLKVKNRQEPVSRDTIALVVGNLLGILLIVAYEQKHVIESRGFAQLIRPK